VSIKLNKGRVSNGSAPFLALKSPEEKGVSLPNKGGCRGVIHIYDYQLISTCDYGKNKNATQQQHHLTT